MSLAVKEMKIKASLRFYLTPATMAIMKKIGDNEGWSMWRKSPPDYRNGNWTAIYRSQCGGSSRPKHKTCSGPAKPLLSIYPKDLSQHTTEILAQPSLNHKS